MEIEKLKFIFKEALKLEKDGYKLYNETGRKTANPVGKATFEALAKDELVHIEAIKEFYSSLCDEKTCPMLEELIKGRSASRYKEVVSNTLKECGGRIKESSGDLSAYEFAMSLENNSVTLYKQMLKEIKGDSEAEKLLKFLIEEEERHFDLIQTSYEYLKDPAGWFLKEEKPIMEGG